MAAVTLYSDFGTQEEKNRSLLPLFPHLFAMKFWDQMPWSWFFECWVLSQLFHSTPSPSSRGSLVPLHFLPVECITCISEIVDISPAALIPACISSSLVFHMMYPGYKLNKQGDNIQPCHTSFLILNQSVVQCKDLTVASWPAYTFLRKWVRSSSIAISLRISHNLLWSTQMLLSSQCNRSRCFPGISVLSLWSSECWQFDLWFLCLF